MKLDPDFRFLLNACMSMPNPEIAQTGEQRFDLAVIIYRALHNGEFDDLFQPHAAAEPDMSGGKDLNEALAQTERELQSLGGTGLEIAQQLQNVPLGMIDPTVRKTMKFAIDRAESIQWGWESSGQLVIKLGPVFEPGSSLRTSIDAMGESQ